MTLAHNLEEAIEWIKILGHRPSEEVNRSLFRLIVAKLSDEWFETMGKDRQLNALNALINDTADLRVNFNGLNRCGHPSLNIRNYLLKRYIIETVPTLGEAQNRHRLEAVFELFKEGRYINWEQRLEAISEDVRFDTDFF